MKLHRPLIITGVAFTLLAVGLGDALAQMFLEAPWAVEDGMGLEAECRLPADHVATGVKLRTRPNEITTIVCIGRQIITSSGRAERLGTRREEAGGSEPTHQHEVWAECPPDTVLVRVGARIHDGNVTTLRYWCQPITTNPLLLDDSRDPLEYSTGSAPDHPLEWVVGTEVRNNEPQRTVITGLGAREYRDNVVNLRAWLARLVPLGAKRPGEACSVTSVWDCALQCVKADWVHSWTGDGICDAGTWGLNLNCPHFHHDGGDCQH